jgi:hypothetical protein
LANVADDGVDEWFDGLLIRGVLSGLAGSLERGLCSCWSAPTDSRGKEALDCRGRIMGWLFFEIALAVRSRAAAANANRLFLALGNELVEGDRGRCPGF